MRDTGGDYQRLSDYRSDTTKGDGILWITIEIPNAQLSTLGFGIMLISTISIKS